MALLESAVARPKATFDGEDLYLDPFTKAAALMDSLIHNHPFVDGNKRTGILAAGLFLKRNGWQLNATNTEVEKFALFVTLSKPTIHEIAHWLKTHTTREKQ